jgi:uncharacterized Zn finger protein (UPF0148 family)
VSAQICGYRLYKPFHEEEERSCAGRVETCVGCPVCGGPLVNDLQRGEVVCAQCGLVVAEATVDTGPERRVFDEREKRRIRTAPLKLVVKTDMAVKPEHGAR